METKIMQTGLAARQQDPAREQEMHGLATAPNFSSNWFAAYTNSHHEKSGAAHFAERQIESFLPLYATLHRWKNRCEVSLELPLFPNYVFVRIDPRKRVRVLEVPGVVSLVGFGRNLAPLPDFEIEALRSGLGKRTIEPHPYLVIGERVRIKRSEEHTSELQSHLNLVCRLLLEKKNITSGVPFPVTAEY